MSIDAHIERLISLKEAAGLDWLPRRLNVSTLWRWACKGLRGVRLETVRVGRTLCTSEAALRRFFDRLDEGGAAPGTAPATRPRSPVAPRQEDVERQLDYLGVRAPGRRRPDGSPGSSRPAGRPGAPGAHGDTGTR